MEDVLPAMERIRKTTIDVSMAVFSFMVCGEKYTNVDHELSRYVLLNTLDEGNIARASGSSKSLRSDSIVSALLSLGIRQLCLLRCFGHPEDGLDEEAMTRAISCATMLIKVQLQSDVVY